MTNWKLLPIFTLTLLLYTIANGQSPENFTSPGTYTWTVPPCVTSITVKVWGAGGGGGAAWVKMDNNSSDSFGTAIEACAGGGGGGGGGYTQQTYTVVPGQTYTITVGAGGNGGTASSSNNSATDGAAGGLSSFTGNSYNLTANGGAGGIKANSYNSGYPTSHMRTGGAGGTGGTASGGSVNYSGGSGSLGTGGGSFDFSGAGGGGAGSNGNGGDAGSPVGGNAPVGGTGGTGANNGASGNKITSGTKNGNSASGVGGGGSGGVAHTTGYSSGGKFGTGGKGANGKVTIEYTTDGTAPSQPSAISGSTTIACGTTSGTYSVTNVLGITYTWSYSGSGTVTGSGNSITLDNITSGGTLTVTPSNGCGNGTPQTITITTGSVPAQPSAISGSTTIACGATSSVYSVTNVPGVTYTWSYSGGGTITGSGNSVTLDNITSGGTLTVTPSNGCGNGTPQTITITTGAVPAQPSAISGSTTIACGTTSGTYSVTNVPGVTYTWTYSGGGTITGNGNSITLDNIISGGILTVTPSNSCGNGTPQTITITTGGTTPSQPSAISGSTTIACGATSGTYSVTNVPGVTYTWSYSGSGTVTGSGNSITLNNITSGGTLTVTPSNGCGNGTPQTITITTGGTTPSQPSAISGSTTIACGTTSGAYSVTNVPGVTYTWSYSGNGTITGNGNSITLDNITSGGTLTVTPSNGCGNGTPQTITITTGGTTPSQSSAISGSTTIACGTTSGTYSVTNVSGVTYTWSYSGGGTITGNGNSITLDNITSGGTLTVTPSNACGNGTPQTITITTGAVPVQPSTISGSTTIACGTTSGIYSVTNVPGVTYTWSYSGSGTITGSGNSITLNNVTSGGILTVAPSNTCGNGTPQIITIAVGGTFQIDMSSTDVVCGSVTTPGTATATPVGGTAPYSYHWSNGGTTSSISNLSTGTYTVLVTDAGGCQANGTVAVNQTSNIAVQVSPSPATVTEGESVQLNCTFSPYIPGSSYTWTPPNSLSCSNCPSPVASPQETTTYTVTITTPDGCNIDTTVKVFVKIRCGEIFIPNIFSPNGDGENDVFKVHGKCIEKISMKIYDRWGELLFETSDKTEGWDGTYRDKLMNTGVYVYIISVNLNDGSVETFNGNVALTR